MFKKTAAAVAFAAVASVSTAASSFSVNQSISADISGATIVASYDTASGTLNVNTVFSSSSFPYTLSDSGITLLGTYDIGEGDFTDVIAVGAYTL